MHSFILSRVLKKDDAGGRTIAAIRSDGKTYTTKVNTYHNFEFFLDTGRYTIRAYTPKGDWTAWETVVTSTRRYQRDTTFLVVRCKNTPHLSLDIGTPSLHACQENEYVIQFRNTGIRGVPERFLEVTLDSLMDFVESSYPVNHRLGQKFRFSLGAIHAATSNQIKIKVHLGCGDSFRSGRACRVKAVLYPDSLETHLDMKISEALPNSHELQAEIRENLAAIDYTLRFGGMQKDTLSMVAFRDTLSEWLDPSTIEILSSNPACIWELVDGSILQLQVLDALLPNCNIKFCKMC